MAATSVGTLAPDCERVNMSLDEVMTTAENVKRVNGMNSDELRAFLNQSAGALYLSLAADFADFVKEHAAEFRLRHDFSNLFDVLLQQYEKVMDGINAKYRKRVIMSGLTNYAVVLYEKIEDCLADRIEELDRPENERGPVSTWYEFKEFLTEAVE